MLYPPPPAEREYRETTWKNETLNPQVVVLDGKRLAWKPGETRSLDSQYDTAIQTVHGGEKGQDGRVRGGTVVGGLAPRLTNLSLESEERAPLHESLDSDLQARREAEAAALVAQKAVTAAETNAILAQAKADKAKAPAESKASK